MHKTVLVFAPHADDAEFFAGGTIALMAEQGVKVFLVTVSDGSRGSFRHTSADLIRLRVIEATEAARVLGAELPIFLGHPDLELDTLPAGLLREQFIFLIRKHRPDIVIAEDAYASHEVHPDHRAVAWAVSDALNYATLPLMHPEHLEQGLEPHFVKEKYFYGSPIDNADKIIDITTTLPIKLAALAEHHTQVEFLVEDVLRQVRAIGLDLEQMLAPELKDPMTALSWMVQTEAALTGQKIGAPFAEAFRFTRFHPSIEFILKSQLGG